MGREGDKNDSEKYFDLRLRHTEQDFAETKLIVKKILSMLTQGQKSRSPQRSPIRNRSSIPSNRQTRACFRCSQEGYFMRDCTAKQNRSRSPSPNHINFSKSRMMADSLLIREIQASLK